MDNVKDMDNAQGGDPEAVNNAQGEDPEAVDDLAEFMSLPKEWGLPENFPKEWGLPDLYLAPSLKFNWDDMEMKEEDYVRERRGPILVEKVALRCLNDDEEGKLF